MTSKWLILFLRIVKKNDFFNAQLWKKCIAFNADRTKHTVMRCFTGFVVCVLFSSEERNRSHSSTCSVQTSADGGGTGEEIHCHHRGVSAHQWHEGTQHTHTTHTLSWSGLCVTSPSAAVAPPLLQEALQCVAELSCSSLLSVFVRTGMESMLERSTITREHLGLLFHQLVKTQTLSTQQYYKGWDTSSLCVCVLLECLLIFSITFISLFIFAVLLSF